MSALRTAEKAQPVLTLAECGCGPSFADISVAGLAALYIPPANRGTQAPHEAMRLVDFQCSQGCGTILNGPRFFSSITACDSCRAKALKEDAISKARVYWEAICPPAFRETKLEHAGFPRPQYDATRQWYGDESLFLYGPTGSGKTRLAMWLLKRALVERNKHVGVLWPYMLKAVKSERETIQWVQRWGKYDVLLLDDPLQGAADGRVTEALKDLLAYRQDHKRPNVITSQIGGDDYADQAAKFGKETKADKEVIEALLRRLRETCRVIGFAGQSAQAAPAMAGAVAGSSDEPF